MADKTQGSIPAAAEQLRGLLVEAAQASQAGPTVGRQQAEAEAEAEIVALDRILAASDAALQALADFRKGRSTARCEKAFGALEAARAEAAALAEAGGNKRLAKACRAVAKVSQPSEFSISIKIGIREADQKARALLTSCRAHARARAARAERDRAEANEWKRQQTELQGSVRALATLARLRGAAE